MLRFAYAQDLQTSRHLSVHHSQSDGSWVVASEELDLPFQNGWVRPRLKHMNLKKGEKATETPIMEYRIDWRRSTTDHFNLNSIAQTTTFLSSL